MKAEDYDSKHYSPVFGIGEDAGKPQTHVTMQDIAGLLQISIATVSRALNGSAKVGNETLNRVQQAAKILNYVMNEDASDLRKKGLQNTPDSKSITINDFAKRLNVSPSTVSRSFGRKGDVSDKTKAMVLQAAAAMGFTFQEHARRLRSQK